MPPPRLRALALCALFAALPLRAAGPWQDRADRFLALANAGFQSLSRVDNEAQWTAATDVTPAHDAASETSRRAFAAFNGSPALITGARELLAHRRDLAPVTVRQLEQVLLNAAECPMTNPALVEARTAAETRQESLLNSFAFHLGDRAITLNDLDDLLARSRDLDERRAAWESSKACGPALKPGLVELRDLRNSVARELGYPDYFALEMAAYGMTTAEMVRFNDACLQALRPLYLQLHTWAKYELARRYGRPVPNRLPAHWLDNRYAQEWPGLVPAADLDARFQGRTPEWIVRTAESFYTGLGFAPLPDGFWKNSDLYPVSADGPRHKNSQTSCWHIDLGTDIRALMNVEPNADWWGTAHHELGHAHYFNCYARPEVPPLLRSGANPGFQEGIAELAALACQQDGYLRQTGVLPAGAPATDPVARLLDDALCRGVVFMFFASGPMLHWEADLYAGNLPPDRWNARWWQYVREFQGVEPPAARGEEWGDAATKSHISDSPCYYPSYAFATVLKYQLNDYIARHFLHQLPQSCNFAGHPEVGAFLRRLMEKGATEDWRKLLRETTGEELSPRAMVEYYRPLLEWLEEQNRGRKIGWE